MNFSTCLSCLVAGIGLVLAAPAAATLTITGITCASATSSVDASGNVTVNCTPAATTTPPPTQTPTAPGAPTISSITPSSTSLSITFAANAATPGTAPVSYSATCGTGGATSGSGTPGSGSASPLSVTGLASAATYSCVVKASNSAGSATSPAVQATTTAATAAGNCTNGGGIAWTNFSSPGLTVAGTLSGGASQYILSYSFVMAKNTFPTGAQILLNVSGSYSNPRDHFISSCPGDFTTPPAGNTLNNCQRLNIKGGSMYLGYTDDPTTQLAYTCNLVPGQTYYLNMRTIYSASQGAYMPSGYLLGTNSR